MRYNCIKHFTFVSFFLLLFSITRCVLGASDFDIAKNPIKFTEAPNPFNMGNSWMNMNYRSSFDAQEGSAYYNLKLIATSQPYTLVKAEKILDTLKIDPKNVTMVDLRHEVHFNILLKEPFRVDLINYQFDIPVGWYSISMVNDSDGDNFTNTEVVGYLKNYLREHGSIPVDIQYKFPSWTNNSSVRTNNYVNIPCADIKSDEELYTELLHMKYVNLDVHDEHAIGMVKAEEFVKNYYNNNKDDIYWVHCWGGNGRTSQFIGMMIMLRMKPVTADELSLNILSFSNGKDMFEYGKDGISPGKQFVKSFWEKYK